jgi:hypothetical protein
MISTATTPTGRDVLTHSSMACFKSCRQKYYWSYELGWRPDKSTSPLRIGQQVHEGLNLLAKGFTPEQVVDVLRSNYDGLNEHNALDLQYERETVVCLVLGYHTAWGNSQVEIIESETAFDLPIINPNGNAITSFRQAGKRDRVCRLPDGRIALMETKTVGEDISPGSDYRNVLSINQQISMYVNAAIAEGKQIDTTLYDCIRKPTIRPCPVPMTDYEGKKIVLDAEGNRVLKKNGEPRQTADTAQGYVLQTRDMTPEEWARKLSDDIAERPDYYYQRFEVPRLADDLEAFNTELWMIAKDIGECRRTGRWYRNTANCRMFHSMCPYYPLCAGEKDTSNGVPAGFRQVETVHEELAEGE